MRGFFVPRRTWTSGLCSGCPGTIAAPNLFPPAIKEESCATEKPLDRFASEWQFPQRSDKRGRIDLS
jgi:hypothetical protein